MQPYEFVIIAGSSLGIFIVANTMTTIKDCGKAFLEAVLDKVPKPRDYLDVLSVLHALMRELGPSRAAKSKVTSTTRANPRSSRPSRNCSPTRIW